MEEIWKDVSGYEGLYQVSSFGNVRKFKNHFILKKGKHHKGYLYVSLTKSKINKKVKIHRIVALSFLDNPENKTQVNHKDGNKQNNILSNLEWTTPSENLKHAWDNKLRHYNLKIRTAIKNKNSKIVLDTSTGIFYNSLTEMCLILDINYYIMSEKVKNNKTKYIYV